MGILNSLKSFISGRSKDSDDSDSGISASDISRDIDDSFSDDPIYFDRENHRLSADDITGYIKSELEKCERARKPFELQWTLNSNFLSGHQNCAIRVSDETIQDSEPVHEYDSHEIFNVIKPLIDTRTANFMSLSYTMTVKPMTSELDDHEKADISTKLLRYTQTRLGFDAIKNTIISYLERMGNVYLLSWWNKNIGDVAARISIDSSIINGENEENQRQAIETEVHEGDLDCGILSPYELYVSDVYRPTVADQRYIITKQVMPVDDIYDRWGIVSDGHECDSYIVSPSGGSGDFGVQNATFAQIKATVPDSEYVITYYEKASRRYPKGRLAILIGDNLIHYSALPYDEIPVTAIKCKEEAGCFYGKSAIDELIPLQRAYNGVKNRILDYYKRIAFPAVLMQTGTVSNIDDYAERGIEPGEVIAYSGNSKPDFMNFPNLPDGIINEVAQLKADMEYTAGVSQLMVYGKAADGSSGKAIDSRREIDSTRMSLTGENIRIGIRELSVIWLHIYKRYATGYRCVKISGLNDIGGVITWCRDDITSFDVRFDSENELKYSEENQKQAFITAFQMGLFADDNGSVPQEIKDKAIEILKVGSTGTALTEKELQIQAARRENSYFDCGIVPETNQYDDHDIHLSEHRKYVMQEAYFIKRRKSPELAAQFDRHIAAHAQIIVQREQNKQASAMASAGVNVKNNAVGNNTVN